jgi:hypothetical protein
MNFLQNSEVNDFILLLSFVLNFVLSFVKVSLMPRYYHFNFMLNLIKKLKAKAHFEHSPKEAHHNAWQ